MDEPYILLFAFIQKKIKVIKAKQGTPTRESNVILTQSLQLSGNYEIQCRIYYN